MEICRNSSFLSTQDVILEGILKDKRLARANLMHKKDLSGQAKYLGVMSLKDFILYFYSKRGLPLLLF